MKKAIIGKKLGMTQVFTASGIVVPVTVVEAGPMVVIGKKTAEKDGYESLVVAFGNVKENRLSKPKLGTFKKVNVQPKKIIKEFKLEGEYEIGAEIKCDIFTEAEKVDVSGTTRGRGFSGVIVRHNHRRNRMSHGAGPIHREVITVIRSPHKDKDSREQFESRTHKRMIDIYSPSSKAVDALTKIELPAGVDIDIKI